MSVAQMTIDLNWNSYSVLKWITRESLLNGNDQYNLPPCTKNFRTAALKTITIFLFYKTTYLNEEVNCTEFSNSVRIPWYNIISFGQWETKALTLRKKTKGILKSPFLGN
jgi:hypothetical protein